jgi:hypothetical protein
MVGKISVVLLVVATLIGCATPQIKYVTRIETVTVYKPIYTPPTQLRYLPTIPRPDLATNYLNPEDAQKPGHVVKLTIESVAQLRTYAEQLEDQIMVYRRVLLAPSDPLPEPSTTVSEKVEYRNDK